MVKTLANVGHMVSEVTDVLQLLNNVYWIAFCCIVPQVTHRRPQRHDRAYYLLSSTITPRPFPSPPLPIPQFANVAVLLFGTVGLSD